MSTTVFLTFDFDAQFLWIGSFRNVGLQSMSRGEYGAAVGVPRILELLAREGIPATFFIPGRVAETYPALVREIAAGGHAIGAHGYAHERWGELERDVERGILHRSRAALRDCIGQEVHGFRSPAWELNSWSCELLEEMGFRYDSTLMADDFRPYRLRKGDHIPPEGPLSFGPLSQIVEIPVAWELDDFPYFAHTHRSQGLRDPDEVLWQWLAEYGYAAGLADSVFTLTLHPQVTGRGPRLEMLRKFIQCVRGHEGSGFSTVDEFLARSQPGEEMA